MSIRQRHRQAVPKQWPNGSEIRSEGGKTLKGYAVKRQGVQGCYDVYDASGGMLERGLPTFSKALETLR